MMSFFSPTTGDRYRLHIYDTLLDLDGIERGALQDDVTAEQLAMYDPPWWMNALELLRRLREAVDEEIVRCISDARADWFGEDRDLWEEFDFAVPTWEEIGKRLGVSPQAAQQRYAKKLQPHSITADPSEGAAGDRKNARHPTGLTP